MSEIITVIAALYGWSFILSLLAMGLSLTSADRGPVPGSALAPAKVSLIARQELIGRFIAQMHEQ